jgi:hypothetical protein
MIILLNKPSQKNFFIITFNFKQYIVPYYIETSIKINLYKI